MKNKRILILGVGNILLGDEGVGVHALRQLQEGYVFPGNVTLMDGGTLGLALMSYISDCDVLIVLDAVRGGGTPGTAYRLEGDALRQSRGFSDSLHQLDLLDALTLCDLTDGHKPETVVFGLEPKNMEDMSLELSQEVFQGLPKLMKGVLDELEKRGVAFRGRLEREKLLEESL